MDYERLAKGLADAAHGLEQLTDLLNAAVDKASDFMDAWQEKLEDAAATLQPPVAESGGSEDVDFNTMYAYIANLYPNIYGTENWRYRFEQDPEVLKLYYNLYKDSVSDHW